MDQLKHIQHASMSTNWVLLFGTDQGKKNNYIDRKHWAHSSIGLYWAKTLQQPWFLDVGKNLSTNTGSVMADMT